MTSDDPSDDMNLLDEINLSSSYPILSSPVKSSHTGYQSETSSSNDEHYSVEINKSNEQSNKSIDTLIQNNNNNNNNNNNSNSKSNANTSEDSEVITIPNIFSSTSDENNTSLRNNFNINEKEIEYSNIIRSHGNQNLYLSKY